MFIIKSLPLGKIIALFGIFVKKGGENQEKLPFRGPREILARTLRSRGVINSIRQGIGE